MQILDKGTQTLPSEPSCSQWSTSTKYPYLHHLQGTLFSHGNHSWTLSSHAAFEIKKKKKKCLSSMCVGKRQENHSQIALCEEYDFQNIFVNEKLFERIVPKSTLSLNHTPLPSPWTFDKSWTITRPVFLSIIRIFQHVWNKRYMCLVHGRHSVVLFVSLLPCPLC